MPALDGTTRVFCGIDADGNIRAISVDENDNLIIASDIRQELGIAGASQVNGNGIVAGAGSVLYTVASGKTLYLTDVALTGYNGNAALQFGYLYIYASGAVLRTGWRLGCAAGHGANLVVPFSMPFKMVAGDYLQVSSPDADYSIMAFYHGLLI